MTFNDFLSQVSVRDKKPRPYDARLTLPTEPGQASNRHDNHQISSYIHDSMDCHNVADGSSSALHVCCCHQGCTCMEWIYTPSIVHGWLLESKNCLAQGLHLCFVSNPLCLEQTLLVCPVVDDCLEILPVVGNGRRHSGTRKYDTMHDQQLFRNWILEIVASFLQSVADTVVALNFEVEMYGATTELGHPIDTCMSHWVVIGLAL